MNLKHFLHKDKVLNESCTLGNSNPVVLGYASFNPFHIGYLPMISEMVKLSEQYGAEAILVIIKQDTPQYDQMLPTILETLGRDFGFLKVSVEREVDQSLLKMNQYDRYPVAVVGESKLLARAKATCNVMYKDETIEYSNAYLGKFQTMCEEAVYANDYTKFKSCIIEVSDELTQNMFEQLQEALDGKQ